MTKTTVEIFERTQELKTLIRDIESQCNGDDPSSVSADYGKLRNEYKILMIIICLKTADKVVITEPGNTILVNVAIHDDYLDHPDNEIFNLQWAINNSPYGAKITEYGLLKSKFDNYGNLTLEDHEGDLITITPTKLGLNASIILDF